MLVVVISVIIPVFNAEADLVRTLAALVPAAAEGVVREVVIVDGGSTDRSLAIAEDAGAVILRNARGRGTQMHRGAEVARSDWLLFLHGDTALAPDWAEHVRDFIAAPASRNFAAAFRLRFDDPSPEARRVEFWVGVRCGLFRLPYGDQGLLIHRDLYARLGGFAQIPFLEDVDFVRRIGRRRMRMLPANATTSAAKYRRDGWRKRTWHNLGLVLRFYFGARPQDLARFYD